MYQRFPLFNVPVYPQLSEFPINAVEGQLAVNFDTATLYIFKNNAWVLASGGGGSITRVTKTGAILTADPNDGQAPESWYEGFPFTTRTSITVTTSWDASLTAKTAFYTRYDVWMYLEIYIVTRVGVTGEFVVALPNVEGADVILENASKPKMGYGILRDISEAKDYELVARIGDTNQINAQASRVDGGLVTIGNINATSPVIIANGDVLSMFMILPINEWTP